jgi:nucleoid-associated protein YgaU
MGIFAQHRKFVALGAAALVLIQLSACSMGQTEGEDDSIDVAAGPDSAEVAETDAAPAESAELAAETATPEASAEVAPEAVAEAPPVSEEPAPVAEAAPPAEQVAVAEAAPPADPVPVAAAASGGGGGTYSIQSGDTLMKVAFETYGDLFLWRKIYEANQSSISDPNRIEVGTVLTLPMIDGREPASVPEGSEKYRIRNGDTLGTISAKVYGDKSMWRRLWDQNRAWIKDPNRIFAGFFLYYSLTEEDRARVPASQ